MSDLFSLIYLSCLFCVFRYPGCPVCPDGYDNHDDHDDNDDHHYSYDHDNDDPDDHDVHGDTNLYKIVFQVLMVGLDDLLALRNIDRVKVKQLFIPNFKYFRSLKTMSQYKHQVS